MFSIFFNQVLIFTILRRHWLFLLEIFKVKAAIGRPLRWTKCTIKSDLFFLKKFFLVFLHFVMWFCCFPSQNFQWYWLMLLLIDLELSMQFYLTYWNTLIMNIFLSLSVEYQKSKKVFNIVILLLFHPIFLVKFLLKILCVFLKSVCYFYFGHSITNNWHFQTSNFLLIWAFLVNFYFA